MTELVVIVPSRGRPHTVDDLVAAFVETCTARTELVLALDEDDPAAEDYPAIRAIWQESGTMVSALNRAAVTIATDEHAPFAIGFMGDDHRPRSTGWDSAYVSALAEMGTGIVYGDDLWQREALPTQCAMTVDIVRALGHMAPPVRHMYVDNYWLDLGRAADCIRYLPGVVVEHMHPVAGKALWDEGHRRVNAPEVYEEDRAAYTAYRSAHLTTDAMRVRALRQVTQ